MLTASAPAMERPAAPTTYVWDGVEYRLDEPLRDRYGTTWTHTGEWEHGEPLYRSGDGLHVMALPDLYADLWPLRPIVPRLVNLAALLAATSASPACAVCPLPARPGSAHCSQQCRNTDDPHDDGDPAEEDH